ncbi:unnamed protein product [Tetraodon nigroviridis]|uniref:Chromosome undetermined SCAF14702, whole genome shotgun sequence n=1 Tax=Tetraodon nigroviridis TaxID=99883 RepID=Q4S918_TETNG|nr:unnamed protein product [Tetraodon nigroviridis]
MSHVSASSCAERAIWGVRSAKMVGSGFGAAVGGVTPRRIQLINRE